MAEMVGWLRQGVGELIRQASLQLMDLLMQEEVRELAGERSQRQAERTAVRIITVDLRKLYSNVADLAIFRASASSGSSRSASRQIRRNSE